MDDNLDRYIREMLSEMHKILRNTSVFYYYSKYLFLPASTEEKLTADNNTFLRTTRIAYWRLTVIEICKIVEYRKESEGKKAKAGNYSLVKLVNKLETNYNKVNWGKPPKKEELYSYQTIILKIIDDERTKSLKILRNKFYSHLDDHKLDINELMTMNFEQFENYLNQLKSIFNFFMLSVTGSGETKFELPHEIYHLKKLMETYSKYRLELKIPTQDQSNND